MSEQMETIAKEFEMNAWRATAFSDRLHKTKREKLIAESRAQVWQQAAQMLRKYGSAE